MDEYQQYHAKRERNLRAMRRACPKCGALPRQPCRTRSGTEMPVTMIHEERVAIQETGLALKKPLR